MTLHWDVQITTAGTTFLHNFDLDTRISFIVIVIRPAVVFLAIGNLHAGQACRGAASALFRADKQEYVVL